MQSFIAAYTIKVYFEKKKQNFFFTPTNSFFAKL